MPLIREIALEIAAQTSLLVLVTREETRAVRLIREVADLLGWSCLSWSVSDGYRWELSRDEAGLPPTTDDPVAVLTHMASTPADAGIIYVLKDFHTWYGASSDPMDRNVAEDKVVRRLRSLAQDLSARRACVVITTPIAAVPVELSDEAVVHELPYPDAHALRELLDELIDTFGAKVTLTEAGHERLIRDSIGLTLTQARRVYARAVARGGTATLADSDLAVIADEKRQIISASEALEVVTNTVDPDDVGGLQELKSYLMQRQNVFTADAEAFGVDTPRGIILVGIPGNGKSMTAKAIGRMWEQPVLRLDIGSLFQKWVGESEERARHALQLAEKAAPCVVWIDEIEKALSQSDSDSGTSKRVFATILTWMQEKTRACFVVATANDVSRLPAELLRRGRFDEIFFLDLPTTQERIQIISTHIRRRSTSSHPRQAEDFDLARLADECAGFVGAEIEQAIKDAITTAYFEQKRAVTTEDISLAIHRLVPLSKSAVETVETLRNWMLEGRARSASFADVEDAREHFVAIGAAAEKAAADGKAEKKRGQKDDAAGGKKDDPAGGKKDDPAGGKKGKTTRSKR